MKKEVNQAEAGILRLKEQAGWQQCSPPPCAVFHLTQGLPSTHPGVLQGQGTQGWG